MKEPSNNILSPQTGDVMVNSENPYSKQNVRG
jgi:hypothetical protein